MKTLKTILLAVILLFSANTLMAQTKYQFATVAYKSTSNLVGISINASEFTMIKVSSQDIKDPVLDLNPALKEVNKLTADGWEVFDTGVTGVVYLFYLRKKVS